MIKKIIMVYKTHFDIGFTDLAGSVIQRYTGPMLDELVSVCEGTKDLGKLRYVWTLPAWPLKVMTESGGEKRRALDELIKNGQVVWHALPYTIHFDFCALEDFIQGLKYSRELSEIYGKPRPVSAKMTDVPGHGSMLPAILAGAGIKFLHLGCNEFAMPPEVPPLFFWESPDGSRVLTMYDKGGYGSGMFPPEGWEYPVWMAFMHTSDNIGPHSLEEVRAFIQKAREAFPDAEIISGSMDDFYRELSSFDLSNVPLVNKDLADTWIHGVGSYPKEVSLIRDTRNRVSAAKKIYSLTGASKSRESADFMKTVNEAYDNLILFSEHTWGLDVKTWLGSDRVYDKQEFLVEKETPKYMLMEASWREQALRAEQAGNLSELALKSVQNSQELCVFNPNGSPFTGWACFDKALNGYAAQKMLTCPNEEIFGRTCVYVRAIPALSAVKLMSLSGNLSPAEPMYIYGEGCNCSAENHRYRIQFSKDTGIIHSVFDKAQNAVILQENEGKSVFSYRYDKYGNADVDKFLKDYAYKTSEWGLKDNGRENYPICERETFYPVFSSFGVEGRTLCFLYKGIACEEYGDAEEIELRLTLPSFGDELFVELKLFRKQETPYIESGSLVMPLPFSDTRYMINKNGCILVPETDIVKDANHVFYCLESFIAAHENQTGICAVAHDTPLVSIGETGVYTFRRDYEEHSPHLYFNLFNNMWGTNFPQWIGGDFTYRFTLFGFTETKNVMQRALSLTDSARIIHTATFESPVYLPDNLQTMAVESIGKGISIRIRDTSGKSRSISIRGKHENTKLCLLDLTGNPITAVSQNVLSFDLKPYAICTIFAEY